MNKIKSHFKFNKQERNGIFFLLLIILLFQGVHLFVKTQPYKEHSALILDEKAQTQLDSLKSNSPAGAPKVFPFNPNYITDYKGYALGMSTEEIDRLFAYRAQNRYVNTAEEFQKVTQVSDSLFVKITPYLKFPNWKSNSASRNIDELSKAKESVVPKKDINAATAEEIKIVKGIGEVLSKRIVKFRDRLGGFINKDQLKDVYGLEPEVVARIWKKFDVISTPNITKIDLNKASAEQLSKLIYINRTLAQQIVAFRAANGPFNSLDDLAQVANFPSERIERIKLYLQL